MNSVPADASPATDAGAATLIEVVGADRVTLALLQEWLRAAGYRVVERDGEGERAPTRPALTIADVPFARQGAPELLRRIAQPHPGTPVLALSPTFFGNVRCDGDCARKLGVAGVLPKPLTREALLAAVDRILGPAR